MGYLGQDEDHLESPGTPSCDSLQTSNPMQSSAVGLPPASGLETFGRPSGKVRRPCHNWVLIASTPGSYSRPVPYLTAWSNSGKSGENRYYGCWPSGRRAWKRVRGHAKQYSFVPLAGAEQQALPYYVHGQLDLVAFRLLWLARAHPSNASILNNDPTQG